MLRWTGIKSAYSNPLIKISYAVLIGLPIIIEILELYNKKIKFENSFYQIFYSSVGLLIMFLIYRIFAPSEIKDNADIEAFINRRKQTLNDYLPDKRKEIVLANLDDAQLESQKKIINLTKEIDEISDESLKQQKLGELNSLVDQLFPGCVTRYLEHQWINANTRVTIPLVTCAVIYIASAIIICFVCYQRIMTVIHTQI